MIYKSQSVFLCVTVVLAKPRTLCVLGRHHHQVTRQPFFIFNFETGSHWITQTGLELVILLLHPLKLLVLQACATRSDSKKSRLYALLVQFLGMRDSRNQCFFYLPTHHNTSDTKCVGVFPHILNRFCHGVSHTIWVCYAWILTLPGR